MFEKVCGIFSEFTDADVADMTLGSELLGELEINSLEIMEAVIQVEKELQIEVPERIIHSFRKIGDIVDYIGTCKAQG